MKFNVQVEIPFERQLVFETYRDQLVELVPYMANVQSIEIRTREVEGDVVKLFNVWKGTTSDVPAPLRPIVSPDVMSWNDSAVWDASRFRCDWEITLPALPEAVTAKGFTNYQDDGDVTVVSISGEFIIHPDRVPGVPSFMAKRLAPTLEKFVVGLLQPNLKKSTEAVESYLEDHA